VRRPPSTVGCWVAERGVHRGAPQQPPRGPEVRWFGRGETVRWVPKPASARVLRTQGV